MCRLLPVGVNNTVVSARAGPPAPLTFLTFLTLLTSYASSAIGQLRLLSYRPQRSKQQGRRLPADIFDIATSIRFTRVSAFFPETIQKIQSRRATAVISAHVSLAFGGALSSAS